MAIIYAFSNPWGTNVSRLVLSELEKLLKARIPFLFIPINSYPQDFFHKYIKNNRYHLIIGLGDGPKFLAKIKIETRAKNAYQNQAINELLPIYLDLSLPNVDNFDSHFFEIGDNMGTYNCNWLAFQTQSVINSKSLPTYHLFLHLPPRANATLLAEKIKNLIDSNQMLK